MRHRHHSALTESLNLARGRESGVYAAQQLSRKVDAVPERQLASGTWSPIETHQSAAHEHSRGQKDDSFSSLIHPRQGNIFALSSPRFFDVGISLKPRNHQARNPTPTQFLRFERRLRQW
jgi:hypothetical protein